jgi:hypothetical protein
MTNSMMTRYLHWLESRTPSSSAPVRWRRVSPKYVCHYSTVLYIPLLYESREFDAVFTKAHRWLYSESVFLDYWSYDLCFGPLGFPHQLLYVVLISPKIYSAHRLPLPSVILHTSFIRCIMTELIAQRKVVHPFPLDLAKHKYTVL